MEKDAWQHNYRALRAAVDRLDSGMQLVCLLKLDDLYETGTDGCRRPVVVGLCTDISKHQESDLLKGVLDVPAQHNHSSIFKRVTDARQQLTEIKGLVRVVTCQLLTALKTFC